jgi:hypothetical protein
MGIKIFRDDNWSRIRCGDISRRDIMGLDPDLDRELIGYLLFHAQKELAASLRNYAKEKYGMHELPEPLVNIDDPADTYYWEYMVLKEQITRESDQETLAAAALHSSAYNVAAFAFCRLTGTCFPANENDAYSYRTYSCDRMPGVTEERIRKLCHRIIEKEGYLKDAAEECLLNQKNRHS